MKGESSFTNVEFFDSTTQTSKEIVPKALFSINNINFIEISNEIEVTVQNNTEKELKNISITISHVKEYFEKEVMNQEVDFWFPQEELLFVSPIVPHIDEYLFSIKQGVGEGNGQKILTKRIDLKLINKITS